MQIELPPGMTAEKLRSIAKWMDTHDEIAKRWLATLPKDGLVYLPEDIEPLARAAEIIEGTEIQDDLRAWADHLDKEHKWEAAKRAMRMGHIKPAPLDRSPQSIFDALAKLHQDIEELIATKPNQKEKTKASIQLYYRSEEIRKLFPALDAKDPLTDEIRLAYRKVIGTITMELFGVIPDIDETTTRPQG